MNESDPFETGFCPMCEKFELMFDAHQDGNAYLRCDNCGVSFKLLIGSLKAALKKK